MADLRRLDGSALDVEKLGRNENAGNLLSELAKINDCGRMRAIVSLYLTPEGRWEACWAWPRPTKGFPWGVALLGAMRLAEVDIAAAAINSEPIDAPGEVKPEPAPVDQDPVA